MKAAYGYGAHQKACTSVLKKRLEGGAVLRIQEEKHIMLKCQYEGIIQDLKKSFSKPSEVNTTGDILSCCA